LLVRWGKGRRLEGVKTLRVLEKRKEQPPATSKKAYHAHSIPG
jgi:hypothetical protein